MTRIRFATIADIRSYVSGTMGYGADDDWVWFCRAVELIRDRIEYGRSYQTDAELAERDGEEHIDMDAIYGESQAAEPEHRCCGCKEDLPESQMVFIDHSGWYCAECDAEPAETDTGCEVQS